MSKEKEKNNEYNFNNQTVQDEFNEIGYEYGSDIMKYAIDLLLKEGYKFISQLTDEKIKQIESDNCLFTSSYIQKIYKCARAITNLGFDNLKTILKSKLYC